jgi:UPF0716 protein FxsA
MLMMGVFLFLAIVIEIYVIVQVAQAIGGWETFGLLVLQALVGSWIIKIQGIASIRRIGRALDQRSTPGKELVDGFLLVMAGFLIMVPGFISTAFGVLLLLPPTRGVVRRFLSNRFKRGSYGRIFIATTQGTRYVGRFRARSVQDTTGQDVTGHDVTGQEHEGPGSRPELRE